MKRSKWGRIYAAVIALTIGFTAMADAIEPLDTSSPKAIISPATAQIHGDRSAEVSTKQVSTPKNPYFVAISDTVADKTKVMKASSQWEKVPGYSQVKNKLFPIAYLVSTRVVYEAITYKDGQFQYDDGQQQRLLTPQQAAYGYLIISPFLMQIHRGDAYVSSMEFGWPTFWMYHSAPGREGRHFETYHVGGMGGVKVLDTVGPLLAADLSLYQHGMVPYKGQDYASLSDEGIVSIMTEETKGSMANVRAGKVPLPGLIGTTWDAGNYLGRAYRYGYTLNGVVPGAEPFEVVFGLLLAKENDRSLAVSDWAIVGRTLIGDSLASAEKFKADGYTWYLPRDATAVKTVDDPLHVRIESKNFIYDWAKITVPGSVDRWQSFKNVAGISLAEFAKEAHKGQVMGFTFVEDGVPAISWSGQTKQRLPLIVLAVPNDTGYYRVRMEGLTEDLSTLIDTGLNLTSAMSFVPPKQSYSRLIKTDDFFADETVEELLKELLQRQQ